METYLMTKLPARNRIKPKAGTKATPAERQFHMWVMARGCLVCGSDAVFHHCLQPTPSKRGRRDHLIGVAVCPAHHLELHDKVGDEIAWQKSHGLDLANEAEFNRLEAVNMGLI